MLKNLKNEKYLLLLKISIEHRRTRAYQHGKIKYSFNALFIVFIFNTYYIWPSGKKKNLPTDRPILKSMGRKWQTNNFLRVALYGLWISFEIYCHVRFSTHLFWRKCRVIVITISSLWSCKNINVAHYSKSIEGINTKLGIPAHHDYVQLQDKGHNSDSCIFGVTSLFN